jgi:hypothetical protein
MPSPPPNRVELFDLPSYVYDRRTGNFHGPLPSYVMVSRERIMALIQERIDYHAREIVRLSQALTDGRITLAQWQQGMADRLKTLHLQQAALARGGWQNITPADKRRVTLLLKEQYRYLDGFARDIAAGKLSPAQIRWRAGLYADAGRQSYWKARTADEKGRGRRQERRIAVGDGGTCDPCASLAAKGWRAIGTLPAPGGPPCEGINECRCEKEYR